MVEILFLGTGGGRYVTPYQYRRTGGILIKEGETVLHIDPGPGAAKALRDYGEDVRKIDALLISHAHIDHYTDAPVIIEGMTRSTRARRGTVIVAESLLKEGDIKEYHRNLVERLEIAEPGVKLRVGDVEIEVIPTKHTDPYGVGFVIRGERTITYYSDTGYWEGMERYAEDVIISNLETLSPKAVYHTNPAVLERILEASRPNIVFITHFGLRLLMYGPEKMAKELSEKYGVRVIATRDGYRWAGEKTLFDF